MFLSVAGSSLENLRGKRA